MSDLSPRDSAANPIVRDGVELVELRVQRDQAFAFAWMAVTISIAILLSNFAAPAAGIVVAAIEADQLRVAIANEAKGLATNEQALRETQTALAAMKRTAP